MNMSKAKSPFKGFTVAEINKAERNSYVLQIGNDFYSVDGDMVFTANQVEKYYDNLMVNILHTLDSGNEKQRIAAMKCLSRLHILPLRLH